MPEDELFTEDDRAYQARLDALPKPGTRVRLTYGAIERYPHFIAPAGSRGTVIEATEEVFSVLMDDRLEGSEEWDNCIHWYPRNCDQWPDGEIEVLVPAVLEAVLEIKQAIQIVAPLHERARWRELGGGYSDEDLYESIIGNLKRAVTLLLEGKEEA